MSAMTCLWQVMSVFMISCHNKDTQQCQLCIKSNVTYQMVLNDNCIHYDRCHVRDMLALSVFNMHSSVPQVFHYYSSCQVFLVSVYSIQMQICLFICPLALLFKNACQVSRGEKYEAMTVVVIAPARVQNYFLLKQDWLEKNGQSAAWDRQWRKHILSCQYPVNASSTLSPVVLQLKPNRRDNYLWVLVWCCQEVLSDYHWALSWGDRVSCARIFLH